MNVESLAKLPNVKFLGRQPYESLPAFCKGFDVALIPFPITEATLNANPLKAREYLAAGLPVVSTAIPEVEVLGECRIGRTFGEFVGQIREALKNPGPNAERSAQDGGTQLGVAARRGVEASLWRAGDVSPLILRHSKNIKQNRGTYVPPLAMKILHLMNYAPLGTRAMDHFILEYAKQAKERGWDVSFGFTGNPPKEFAPLACGRYDPSRLDELAMQLLADPPDVIQTSFHSVFEKQVSELMRQCDTSRFVVIDHSSGEGPSPRSWLTPLRLWRGRRVGARVDAIVCVSEYNARRAVERVFLPASKVHVVPNGIDLARFPYKPRDATAPRRVVYVGQLIREKGVQILLDAAKILNDPGIEFVIAGQGRERAALEQQAPSNVRFFGQVADVAELYSTASIVVVPSVWAEAFGLVVVEAMACGAVVLASDAGALPEVVGDCGVIVPKGDAAALAARLRELLDDGERRARLAAAGRARVKHKYQLTDCVRLTSRYHSNGAVNQREIRNRCSLTSQKYIL